MSAASASHGGATGALAPWRLAARYVLFAVVATIANLAMQRLSLAGYSGPYAIVPAILAGTAVGLAVKYVLDKRWIFADTRRGAAANGRLFGLYALTGLATTAVFWGTELGFWLVWRTDAMRELGAIIGLSIGYWTKYRLDRRFVFAMDPKGAA